MQLLPQGTIHADAAGPCCGCPSVAGRMMAHAACPPSWLPQRDTVMQTSSSTCSGCPSVAGRTMARAASASATRWYRGRVLPPLAITSWVKMAAAAAICRRV